MNDGSSWNAGRIMKLVAFAAGFAFVSYEVRVHEEVLRYLLSGGGALPIIAFVILTSIFVVFVIPLDIVFLIPIGVFLWGPIATAFLSIVGWVAGASVAFSLARRYGQPLVVRMVGETRVRQMRERVPTSDLFWSVVFLRMLVPVDLLSYALGLATDMPWRSYVLATLIGVSPFGFYFAYAGTLPAWYQFAAILAALALAALVLFFYVRRRR